MPREGRVLGEVNSRIAAHPEGDVAGLADDRVPAATGAAALTAYLMVDLPDELGDIGSVNLRFGIFVALGGCLTIVVGGMWMRAERRVA